MTAERVARWPVATGAAVGIVFFVVGTRSLLDAAGDTHPVDSVTWVVGLAVLHDLLVVPFVLVVGGALRRYAPFAIRRWTSAGLVMSATVALVAWPLVRGYGRDAENASILPRNYAVGLAATLATIWVGLLVVGIVSHRLHRPVASRAASQPRRRPAR